MGHQSGVEAKEGPVHSKQLLYQNMQVGWSGPALQLAQVTCNFGMVGSPQQVEQGWEQHLDTFMLVPLHQPFQLSVVQEPHESGVQVMHADIILTAGHDIQWL
jgi:hypothetical protein